MKRSFVFALLAAVTITGCGRMKDALSAHADVVARAEGQELSVERMSSLLGNSRAPLRKDIAKTLANIWVNYHLVGFAAASGDSLTDTKAMDDALWPIIANMKARKWYQQVSKSWQTVKPGDAEARYASGDVLAAAHILLLTQGLNADQKAAVRTRIEGIRSRLTPANFAAIAKEASQDPQSGAQGGMLPPFGAGDMVPEFERGVRALKPGEISGIVETQYGYHIIRRATFAEVRQQIEQAWTGRAMAVAESTYIARLEKDAKVEVKPDVAARVRDIAGDTPGHHDDKTVLATSSAGKFTGGRLAQWIESFPPQAGIQQQIQNAPDSVIPSFIRNFVRNELVLKQADSAGVKLEKTEMDLLHQNFRAELVNIQSQLGLDAKNIADSAKGGDRRKVAAERVEKYIDNLMAQRAPYIAVAGPVATILRKKYDASVNDAGVDRAVQMAQRIRAKADSAAPTAPAPASAVPLPKAGADSQRKATPDTSARR